MPKPVEITNADHTAEELQQIAGRCKHGALARRLLAVAAVMRGASRTEAARSVGVDAQTVRRWIRRWNESGVDGLRNRPRGRGPALSASQLAEVADWIGTGPAPSVHGLSRWRVRDIRDLILARFGVRRTVEAVRLLVRRLGFRWVSPRPVHPKADPEAQEAFRSSFRDLALAAVPDGVPPDRVEVWFQDESRAGQKGMLARVWAQRGSRPRIVRDHRYGYRYLFSAASPQRRVAVGHVAERANTGEMNRHLREVAAAVAEGRHAVVVLDGAGWHRSKELEVPPNVSLLRLPPYSPELNPMENVFSFIKGNFLANRMFATVEDVSRELGLAWDRFATDGERIAAIASRSWATVQDDPARSKPALEADRSI